MPAYAVVHLTDINPEKLAAYRAEAGAALKQHGGAVLAGGPGAEALEGEAAGMFAVLTFPDHDAARAWMSDPALASVHALRRAAARAVTVLLP